MEKKYSVRMTVSVTVSANSARHAEEKVIAAIDAAESVLEPQNWLGDAYKYAHKIIKQIARNDHKWHTLQIIK